MNSLLLAVLLALPTLAMPRKPRIDKSMETEGSYANVSAPGHRIVETPAEWRKLWQDIGAKAPPADFSKHVAVAVFAGTRSSGGYSIRFDEPRLSGDALIVSYAVVRPKGMATMALTQPYAVKLLPKSGKKIKVEGREE